MDIDQRIGLGIVAETTAALASAPDLDQGLRALIAGMQRLTDADSGGVRLLNVPDRAADGCRLLFWRGQDAFEWQELPGEFGSNVDVVVATGLAQYTADLAVLASGGDPLAAAAYDRDGLGSSLIVPLRSQGHVIGTLHADSHRAGAFSPELLVPLQVLADHAGGAVARARLREEAAERLRRLEVAVRVSSAVNAAGDPNSLLLSVLEEALTLAQAQAGMVALVDEDGQFVRNRVDVWRSGGPMAPTVHQLYPEPDPDEDSVASVVRTGQQQVAAARRGPGGTGDHGAEMSYVLTPIRHADDTLGVLAVIRPEAPAIKADDLAILHLIAEQVGVAVTRVRSEDRRQEIAELIVHTLALVGAAGGTEEALEALLRGAITLLHGAGGVARAFEPETRETTLLLRVLPDGTLSQERQRQPVPAGSMAAALMDGGPAVLIDDYLELDPATYPFHTEMKRQGIRSSVNVPIQARGQLIGSLHVNHQRSNFFGWAELSIAEALASQAGAAIERAGLVEAERAQMRARLAAEANFRALAETLSRQYREAEAARSEARAILDAAHEAMTLVDPSGGILSLNRRFVELFDLQQERMVGTQIRQIVPALNGMFEMPDGAHPIDDRLDGAETVVTIDLPGQRPQRRDLKQYSRPVFTSDGELLGRLFVLRDVTEERAVDQMKDEFVALISHELRTPLTSIKGYTDLLLAGEVGELSGDQREFLSVIKRNADREVTLVNELLDLSRLESGQVELTSLPLDLGTLLREVASSLRPQLQAKRQEFTLVVPDRLPVVPGDAVRLNQVFTNLLSNAHKYTPTGGRIAITAHEGQDGVSIAVSDDGIGLTEDDQARLFTKFFRARGRATQEAGGTGLGLAITRALVERHGGNVAVASAPGRGSTFTVTLPTVAPA